MWRIYHIGQQVLKQLIVVSSLMQEASEHHTFPLKINPCIIYSEATLKIIFHYFQKYVKTTKSQVSNIFNALQENPVEIFQIFIMGDMKELEFYLVTKWQQFVTQGKWNQ